MSYAFVFPGQGSQSVGMLNELAEQSSIVKETFEEASEALGYDLWEIASQGPVEKLNQTEITQPAMLTAGIAVLRVLADKTDLNPAYYAGHSLGEYTALVASGVLTLSEGVKLVEKRGVLMQATVPEGQGAMAAILGLDDAKIVEICSLADGVVEAVNFNSPGQVVIAGAKQAVDKSLSAFEEVGAKRVVPLAVSVPSHCSLMKPASEALKTELDKIELQSYSAPVIHNATVECYVEQSAIKDALVKQLFQPVQWVQTIEKMKQKGVDQLFEIGPGKVLMGLNRRIDKKMGMQPVFDTATVEKALAIL
jgi:[acyl-carrier-protein] S-malonyltransferase